MHIPPWLWFRAASDCAWAGALFTVANSGLAGIPMAVGQLRAFLSQPPRAGAANAEDKLRIQSGEYNAGNNRSSLVAITVATAAATGVYRVKLIGGPGRNCTCLTVSQPYNLKGKSGEAGSRRCRRRINRGHQVPTKQPLGEKGYVQKDVGGNAGCCNNGCAGTVWHCAPVAAQGSISATRSFSPDTVSPGGQVTVTINAANYGSGGAVTERLPQGFRYVTSSLDSERVDVDPQEVGFTLQAETSVSPTSLPPPARRVPTPSPES